MNSSNEKDTEGTTRHARLARWQWEALQEVFAEMCERTGGSLEDLHDRANGILVSSRPSGWDAGSGTRSWPGGALWRFAYEVLGELAHLADAAPEDTGAIHGTACRVRDLARAMSEYPGGAVPAPGVDPGDPGGALMRLRRAVDGETGRLYRRTDAAERAGGRDTAAEAELRSIGFLLLELGFTVAEEGGVDCAEVERTIARAYGLPGYADPAPAAVPG